MEHDKKIFGERDESSVEILLLSVSYVCTVVCFEFSVFLRCGFRARAENSTRATEEPESKWWNVRFDYIQCK